jgi:carbon monoxide dehydrogenase subunit G
MLTVEESIVVNKPREEVWAFMTDPENVVVYSSNVVEYEKVSGENDEVGRVCRGVVKVAGKRLELTDKLVEVEQGRRGKLVSEDATVPYSLEMRYEDEGDGTKLTWHQEVESLKGVFKFADPIVMRLYARDVRSNLEKAKTILES